MVTTLKQGASKKRVEEILRKLAKSTKPVGIDAYKYCGVIQLDRDALEIQKTLRDEWE